MTDTKFTPGPWRADKLESFGHPVWHISQEDGAPYTPNYSDVCMTCPGEKTAVQIANAHLIAAAPELYEALERCRFDSLNMTVEDLKFIRAAMAKARGEK